ncbi:hypothetical protein J4476_05480 [Candidatus Woesearchaeota archaeon]|nr:MAG: hypothetical protein QT09_C0001G0007 [archaeon GW2011_AR18]MBS3162116.1 hypothetical protein [Candidatus Woesearchaeota archaeon]HIH25254.1 hypothetical protein [Nanoarchaeota archaeon]
MDALQQRLQEMESEQPSTIRRMSLSDKFRTLKLHLKRDVEDVSKEQREMWKEYGTRDPVIKDLMYSINILNTSDNIVGDLSYHTYVDVVTEIKNRDWQIPKMPRQRDYSSRRDRLYLDMISM